MYPNLDVEADKFEKSAGKSVEVFVKVKQFKYPCVGRYYADLDFWIVDSIHGEIESSDIVEWYPIPELGSGEKLC